MLVTQLDIKEFKGIKKFKKPIKLSKFTVMVGRNNSGKSSILEALSLLPHPFVIITPYGKSRRDLLVDLHHEKSSMVYGYSGTAEVDYIIDRNKWSIIMKENGDSETRIGETGEKVAQYEEPMANLLNKDIEEVRKMVFFIPSDSSFIKKLGEIDKKTQNLVTKLGAHIRATKLINECVNDNYTEIIFNLRELRVRKELSDNVFYINVRDLGDGVEKAIIIVLWIEALKPDIILWDDFEASAHPTLVKALLEYLSKKKSQVVISTHSIDVLYELMEIKPKDTKILQLNKTSDDILIYQSLSIEGLEDLIDANHDPRIIADALQL